MLQDACLEYFLENVLEASVRTPRAYDIPSQKDIVRLAVGDIVFVTFLFGKDTTSERCERVAVELTRINSSRLFCGAIRSVISCKSPSRGDIIRFKSENIGGILKQANTVRQVKISSRAFNMRQVNIAVRQRENSSCWYLYLGSEYLEKEESVTKIIELDDVLCFEPRLKKILNSERGTLFAYSQDELEFVEVANTAEIKGILGSFK